MIDAKEVETVTCVMEKWYARLVVVTDIVPAVIIAMANVLIAKVKGICIMTIYYPHLRLIFPKMVVTS